MKLSIVTSLYRTGKYVPEFYRRVLASMPADFDSYEFVFVNDCSPDNGLEELLKLREKDKRVKIIDLARNFGHHPAIRCGLEHAQGDYIFTLGSDLEEAPEYLAQFYDLLKKDSEAAAVYAEHYRRQGTAFRRYAGRIYRKIYAYLSDIDFPEYAISFRLMRRNFLDACLLMKDKTTNLPGLFFYPGFKQLGCRIEKTYKGESGYNFLRKSALAINTIITTSVKPMYILVVLGFLMSCLAFLYACWLIVRKLFVSGSIGISGWTSTMVLLCFGIGAIVFSIGIVGLYISKIFIETRHVPLYVIKNKWE